MNRAASAAPRLLVVDDEATQREMLQGILERAGFAVTPATDGRAALGALESGRFDLVLSDQSMPAMNGLELLRRVRAGWPELPVVLMTAFGSVQTAVEAMKAGAADYLTKPFEKEELLLVLDRVRARRDLEREVFRLRSTLKERGGFSGLVGRSEPMQEVFELVERAAPSDVPVLITGESGTGKELVARAIHERSRRSAGPFVALNCAAVPEHLLETEFFGHEKGAFTGATRTHVGRFEQAQGGTLLLDEIGAMRVDLQAKLLRVLQERSVQRLGAGEPTAVDVRVLAATSEDLATALRERRLREDLYYRLHVVPIHLPPLRERRGDVPLLFRTFLAAASARLCREEPDVAPEVIDRCEEWVWPGNVRELENCVERMVVLARGSRLTLDDLPPAVREGRAAPSAAVGAAAAPASNGPRAADRPGPAEPGGLDLPEDGVSMEELERRFLVQAMRRVRGSLGPAARLLGITYKTLQYRLRKHAIRREEWDDVK